MPVNCELVHTHSSTLITPACGARQLEPARLLAALGVFRRGVPSMIGDGVSSFQFSEINGLAGSR